MPTQQSVSPSASEPKTPPPLAIGIIGFDTSHTPAFTKLLNDSADPDFVPGARVVAGFPSFSPDLESSRSRVEQYTRTMREEFDVPTVDSVAELLERVDAVLLESVDGRRHLAEARPVIEARKPLFIDKPFADNFGNARQIYELAKAHDCPIFSSSSLRYDVNISALKADAEIGEIVSCDAYSPATLDPSNPGLFWYGIHGVEILYTLIGQGCASVSAHHTPACDLITARWADGRFATLRGLRLDNHPYGATVFGRSKVKSAQYSPTVPMYGQLLQQIIPFFGGAAAPVSPEETLEIMAFMQAVLLSEREHREVALAEISGAR